MFILPAIHTGEEGVQALLTIECQRCGNCCSTMGEIISIQEEIRPFDFRIGYTNGEERLVSVDPDKRELFLTQQDIDKKLAACPFLRQLASHERVCTEYASRPELCRNYLCSRILIPGRGGGISRTGVQGNRSFTT